MREEVERPEVKVAFRKLDGEAFAIFPEFEFDHLGYVTSYAIVGQHSACDPDYIDLAEPARAAELRAELKRVYHDYTLVDYDTEEVL